LAVPKKQGVHKKVVGLTGHIFRKLAMQNTDEWLVMFKYMY